jgi:hypothetical protein
MTEIEKYQTIKYLKNLIVRSHAACIVQEYEFGAWLRDREKEMVEKIPNTVTLIDKLNISQYKFAVEMISGFDTYSHSRGRIIEILKKECIDIIRDEKIDKLLEK